MLLEHADELVADGLALVLGVGDAGQAVEEPLGGVDMDQLEPISRRNVSVTCSLSPLRMSPVLT